MLFKVGDMICEFFFYLVICFFVVYVFLELRIIKCFFFWFYFVFLSFLMLYVLLCVVFNNNDMKVYDVF